MFSSPVYDLGYDPEIERKEAEAWLRTTFAVPAEVDLSSPDNLEADPRFQRGNLFWELGLYTESHEEFESLRQELQSDPINSFRLLDQME